MKTPGQRARKSYGDGTPTAGPPRCLPYAPWVSVIESKPWLRSPTDEFLQDPSSLSPSNNWLENVEFC
jgi:hypothetical protein